MLQNYNIIVHLLQRENKMAAGRQTNAEAFVLVCQAILLFVLKPLYRRLASLPNVGSLFFAMSANYFRQLPQTSMVHTRMVRHVM